MVHRESVRVGIVCFILGITSGIILQWPVAKPGDGKSAANRPNQKRSRISKADALTLDSALERVRKPLGNATGDLSDEAIRVMLDELTADRKCWDSESPSRAIINTLVKEWTERDHKAAWDWATTLSENNLREQFSAEVLRQMAHVDLDEALRLLLENHGRMSDGWDYGVVDELMTSAARDGVDAMKRVQKSLPEEIASDFWEMKFPDGFDFPSLAEEIRNGNWKLGYDGNRTLISNWAKADPEAAWNWWLKHPVQVGGISGGRDSAINLIYGYSEIHGEEEALRWLTGKFVETYDDKAASEMTEITEEISDSPWTVTAIAKALPTAAESDYYLGSVAEYQMQDSTERAKVILEAMSSDKLRLDFLHERLSEDSWGDEERTFMQALLEEWGGGR